MRRSSRENSNDRPLPRVAAKPLDRGAKYDDAKVFEANSSGRAVARAFGPLGIHVAHVVVDGAIDTLFIRENFPERNALKEQQGFLDPEAIADNYWRRHLQPKIAWTHELDLRPWIEKW